MSSPLTRPDRRQLLLGAALMGLGWESSGAKPLALPGAAGGQRLRIAFGSCAKQSKPQPIWARIRAARPDLFLFLGDNFYADVQDEAGLRRRYREFEAAQELQAFRRSTPHLAIWDDHDYGDDDAGADYPLRALSQQLFCDAWGEAPDSARRTRPGIYEAYRVEVGGRSVQILMLDLRFNRSPLASDPSRREGYPAMVLRARLTGQPMPGWYLPTADRSTTLLGEPQWEWLEQRLAEPADLRILASSIQVAAEGTGWECWANFPHERERLAAAIRRQGAHGVLCISGDMHYGELSCWHPPSLYPLWDLTSSGLTETWTVPTPNSRREGSVYAGLNFGLLEIDASGPELSLMLSVRDSQGQARIQHTLALSALRLPPL
jgi:alkaline phosphatase D